MKTVSINKRVSGVTALALIAASAIVGCGGLEGDEAVTAEDSALISATGPSFSSAYYQTVYDSNNKYITAYWMKCAPNQVVVGLHKAQQKVICMPVPASNPPEPITSLQVPGASRTIAGMQGCPDGQYIQGIANSGNSGWLLCRKFTGLGWSAATASTDSGTNANTSQSGPVFGLYPNSHVCPATNLYNGTYDAKAMVGLHLGNNVFTCAK